MKLKTYGVIGLMEWEATLKVGNARLHVHFSGGSENKWGITPATFTTKDPMTQSLIEHSNEFKSGRIEIISTNDIAEPKPAKKANAGNDNGETLLDMIGHAQDGEKGPEGSSDEGEGEGTDDGVQVQKVHVDSLDDAKEYLNEKFGIAKSQLRSKTAILNAAAEHSVAFI